MQVGIFFAGSHRRKEHRLSHGLSPTNCPFLLFRTPRYCRSLAMVDKSSRAMTALSLSRPHSNLASSSKAHLKFGALQASAVFPRPTRSKVRETATLSKCPATLYDVLGDQLTGIAITRPATVVRIASPDICQSRAS